MKETETVSACEAVPVGQCWQFTVPAGTAYVLTWYAYVTKGPEPTEKTGR